MASDRHARPDWIEGMQAFFDPSLWLRDPGYHDIFLSHRFADSDAVRAVKAELVAQRFSVYLDLDDNELRGKSDAELAPILRKRMQRSGLSCSPSRRSRSIPSGCRGNSATWTVRTATG